VDEEGYSPIFYVALVVGIIGVIGFIIVAIGSGM